MITLLALGNPGVEYEHTRHNVGWIILENIRVAWGFSEPFLSRTLNAEVSEGFRESKEIRMLFPQTFMNKSGNALKKSVEETGGEVVVLHDDVDIPFGKIRISHERGSAGHNGVHSVIEALGTRAFTRLRIGIGLIDENGETRRPRGEVLSRYVLGVLTTREERELGSITSKVGDALDILFQHGLESAMQLTNRDK